MSFRRVKSLESYLTVHIRNVRERRIEPRRDSRIRTDRIDLCERGSGEKQYRRVC